MATNACIFLCLVLFFALVTQGYGAYSSIKDLSLKQSKTGKMVQNKPEWEVKVTNAGFCYFTDIKLSCVGFQSVTPIDSKVLSKSGDTCLLHGIGDHSDFSFSYVWDTSFDLKIISGTIACS